MKYSLSALAIAGLGAAQSVCPAVPTVTVVPQAVEYPIEISTYIAANTVFNINGDANITINNAPTNLVTTVTGTSTVFSTLTQTVTTTANGGVATPAATTINEPIILAINNNAAAKNKRQAGYAGFLGASAGVAATCQNAETLSLVNGQLFTSAGVQFSTSAGTASQEFSANAGAGTITTTFGVDGIFVWDNGNFTGGSADFCIRQSDNSVQVGFTTTPADCISISFTALLASSCPGLTNGTTTSGVASATGASSTFPVTSAITASVNTTSASSSLSSVSSSISSSLSSVSSSISSSLSSALNSLTSTTSSSVSVATGATSAATTPVQLAFPAPAASAAAKVRRQTTGTTQYITNQGTFSDDQADAATFNIVDGQLFSGSSMFAVDPSTPFMVFIAGTGGSISRTFSNSPSFSWGNESFGINAAHTAEFAISSGTVFAAFQSLPTGATPVAVTASAVGSSTVLASATSASASSASSAASVSSSLASVSSSLASVSSSSASASSASSSSSASVSSSLSSVLSTLLPTSTSSSSTCTSSTTSVTTIFSTFTSTSTTVSSTPVVTSTLVTSTGVSTSVTSSISSSIFNDAAGNPTTSSTTIFSTSLVPTSSVSFSSVTSTSVTTISSAIVTSTSTVSSSVFCAPTA